MTTTRCDLFYPARWCWEHARDFAIVDYSASYTVQVINALSTRIFHKPAIDPARAKTLSQRQRETETNALVEQLGQKSAYVRVAKVSAEYVDFLVPKIAAEMLGQLPAPAFQWIMYQMGLIARYVKRQIDKKMGASDALYTSRFGDWTRIGFTGLRTHAARAIVKKENLLPFISVEHIMLTLFSKVVGQTPGKGTSQRLVGLIVKSLGTSLSYQNDINAFIDPFLFQSEVDKMIARIHWHQQQGHLQDVLPAKKTDLRPHNLEQELDKALAQYVRGALKKYLEKNGPAFGYVTSFFYWLEGKDLFLDVVTNLFIEYGFKLVVDPYLFTLQVLYTTGVEIAEFEPDGFGLQSRLKILRTGQDMMKFASSHSTSPAFIFHDSDLKCPQGGFTVLDQKHTAKERLIEHIAKIIQSSIGKKQDYDVDGIVAKLRQSANRLPVVGIATSVLHVLLSTILPSLNIPELFKHMNEEILCNHIAKRAVELIYHPSWRLTVTELLVTLIDHFSYSHVPDSDRQESISKDDFNNITLFLFTHFTKELPVPVPQVILNTLFDYFGKDAAFATFKEKLKPSGKSLFETAAESSLGVIKELMLYAKVCELFRKRFVTFDGDAKFWEVYIREVLNLRLQKAFSEQIQPPTLDELALKREKLVDELLALSPTDLKINLSKIDIPLLPPRVEQQQTPVVRSRHLPQIPEQEARRQGRGGHPVILSSYMSTLQ